MRCFDAEDGDNHVADGEPVVGLPVLPGVGRGDPVLAEDMELPVWRMVLVCPAGVVVDPADDFFGSCRRVVGCNGYTYAHLGVKRPLLSKEPANFAIFAARMAFSRRPSRSCPR